MRNFWQKVAGILSALAAAPLVGWGSAVILDRVGIKTISISQQPSAQIGLITIKFGPVISLSLNFPQWGFAFWSGIAITAVFAIAVVTMAWRFSNRYRPAGFILSGAVFAAAISGYGWLAWDESPLPKIDPMRLVPNPGMRRPPRELFLEATHAHDNGWPTALIASWTDEPSLEWLHEHADEIRAHWQQLTPIRDWVRQINSYEGFDDYGDVPSAPIVDFKALRQFDYGCRQMALLLALEGHDDQAVAILSDLIVFGRKLTAGSRSLVTLMIGVVMEKGALATIDALNQRKELSASSRQSLVRLLRQPTHEWDDLDRALLNETVWMRSFLIRNFSFEGEPWAMQLFCLLELNRCATVRRYSWEVTTRAQMARNGDFSALQKFEDNFDRQKGRLYMKNFVGKFCIEELRGKLLRMAESLDTLRKRRLELAAALAH